mmetsp:Transcript_22778/g.70442  ORF Transcript_22778/g.70442 Transcript_22778/m.70442 type:complete len:391 (+) Transcript_22778:43-1215(+)
MPRVFARLVVAAACAAARKAPPQIAVRDAAFDVRAVGRSKSVGGAASAFDATVETEDGRCLKLSGARCAEDAASSGVAAAEHVDLLVAATEANCAGFVGLWHFLIKCLSTLLEDFKGFVGALPGEERPAAIVFLDPTNSREASGPCAFGPFVEGYRPLLEAIFPAGAYPSLECFGEGRRVYRHVVVRTSRIGQGWGWNDALPFYRERGFRALGLAEPPRRADLKAVLHLVRDDRGADAHRALASDATLERAFRRAGATNFTRCCDWAQTSGADAIRAVAAADVIVGMHGAAMTHLLWAKKGAVAVELFSGMLLELRHYNGLWFFARYAPRHYGRIFLPVRGRQRRSELNDTQADRVARCAWESSAPRRARPSCDVVRRGSTRRRAGTNGI